MSERIWYASSMMAQPQLRSLTVAHFAAVARTTCAAAEVIDSGGDRDVRKVQQGGRGGVVGGRQPAQVQALALAGQPGCQVVDLVVGLGDDDQRSPGRPARCGPHHQRGLAGAWRRVDDDAALAGVAMSARTAAMARSVSAAGS